MTNGPETSRATQSRSSGASGSRWVAPSKGGYSARSGSGATVVRPSKPPRLPASGTYQRKRAEEA